MFSTGFSDASAAEHLLDCSDEVLLGADQEGERVGHQAGQLTVQRLDLQIVTVRVRHLT